MFNDTTGFQSVHYADNLWLLVGNNGDLRTSTNGLSWTRRTSGTTARIRAAFYANGTWVTVGVAGEVLTSTNAVNWSLRRRQASAQANEQLLDVEFGNGLWVAVGQKGATPDALMLTSGDGRVWTEVPVNGSVLQSVHYHDDLWVATGQLGTALTSTNGADWDLLPPFTSTSLADSILVDGTWTMVGSLGLITRGLPTLDPVTLSILRQESGQVVLSWPAEPAGWEAWSAAHPQGPYAKLGLNPVVIGDRNQLTLPGTGAQGFFRLGTD